MYFLHGRDPMKKMRIEVMQLSLLIVGIEKEHELATPFATIFQPVTVTVYKQIIDGIRSLYIILCYVLSSLSGRQNIMYYGEVFQLFPLCIFPMVYLLSKNIKTNQNVYFSR